MQTAKTREELLAVVKKGMRTRATPGSQHHTTHAILQLFFEQRWAEHESGGPKVSHSLIGRDTTAGRC
jgi:hypothetical protein